MSRHWRMMAIVCAVLLFCTHVERASGQDPQTAEQLPTVTISSVAQPEPSPPLKYMLIPPYAEIKPGNAATSYYRAILMLPRDKEQRFGEEQGEWLSVPLDQFPKDEAREWLKAYENSLNEIKLATHREQCNWDHRVRDLSGFDSLNLLIPEVQECRELARVLRVKSRLEIADGQFEQAADTMTDGYRLAHNLSGSSMLITELVAVAIAGMTNQSIIDWIDADGPNLYWGLASLPRPLVDLRKSLQHEMSFPMKLFPFMDDPESLTYTPQQWRQVIGDSLKQMNPTGGSSKPPSNLLMQTAASGMIMAGYPAAKQALINEGMDPKEVEAMPVGKVIAVRTARVYREVYHESIKWTFVPYSQSYRQLTRSFERLRAKGYLGGPGKVSGIIPIATLFLPAIESAAFAPVRMQRDLSALQTIEALRRAAAEADGKLPKTLDSLEQSPAPLDPVTGQPFLYELLGNKAVLVLPPPEGRQARIHGKRYEVTLNKK